MPPAPCATYKEDGTYDSKGTRQVLRDRKDWVPGYFRWQTVHMCIRLLAGTFPFLFTFQCLMALHINGMTVPWSADYNPLPMIAIPLVEIFSLSFIAAFQSIFKVRVVPYRTRIDYITTRMDFVHFLFLVHTFIGTAYVVMLMAVGNDVSQHYLLIFCYVLWMVFYTVISFVWTEKDVIKFDRVIEDESELKNFVRKECDILWNGLVRSIKIFMPFYALVSLTSGPSNVIGEYCVLSTSADFNSLFWLHLFYSSTACCIVWYTAFRIAEKHYKQMTETMEVLNGFIVDKSVISLSGALEKYQDPFVQYWAFQQLEELVWEADRQDIFKEKVYEFYFFRKFLDRTVLHKSIRLCCNIIKCQATYLETLLPKDKQPDLKPQKRTDYSTYDPPLSPSLPPRRPQPAVRNPTFFGFIRRCYDNLPAPLRPFRIWVSNRLLQGTTHSVESNNITADLRNQIRTLRAEVAEHVAINDMIPLPVREPGDNRPRRYAFNPRPSLPVPPTVTRAMPDPPSPSVYWTCLMAKNFDIAAKVLRTTWVAKYFILPVNHLCLRAILCDWQLVRWALSAVTGLVIHKEWDSRKVITTYDLAFEVVDAIEILFLAIFALHKNGYDKAIDENEQCNDIVKELLICRSMLLRKYPKFSLHPYMRNAMRYDDIEYPEDAEITSLEDVDANRRRERSISPSNFAFIDYASGQAQRNNEIYGRIKNAKMKPITGRYRFRVPPPFYPKNRAYMPVEHFMD